jgi:predicted alpha/beta superfamily hydrolase
LRSPRLAPFAAAALLVLAVPLCAHEPAVASSPPVHSAAAGPTAVAERPIVIGTSYALPSATLGETRQVTVWLPPAYAEGEGRYPVVYLLDGGEHEDFHHISGLAQIGAMNGMMRELIVVGIANTDRRRDMTYPSRDPRDHADAPTHGGSAAFRRFLATELRPWVDGRFRTSGENGVLGESLAGLFIVDTLLDTPALFDTYIAISPSLWWDRNSLVAAAPARLQAKSFTGRRLFLSVADEGTAMGVHGFEEALRAGAPADLDWRFVPMTHEAHSTIYHPAAFAALRALYPSPPPPPAAPAPAPAADTDSHADGH